MEAPSPKFARRPRKPEAAPEKTAAVARQGPTGTNAEVPAYAAGSSSRADLPTAEPMEDSGPISRLPAYAQAKLRVSSPDDEAEREADRVATEIGGRTDAASAEGPAQGVLPAATQIGRTSASADRPGKPDESAPARDPGDAMAGGDAPPQAEARIAARKGIGAALPAPAKTEMEGHFGRDFDDIRIHTDSEAGQLCSEVEARAFTVGNDIYFADGEFAPYTDEGRKLLAHELTHTIQQLGGDAIQMHRTAAGASESATPDRESAPEDRSSVDQNSYRGPEGTLTKSPAEIVLPSVDLPFENITEKWDATEPKANVRLRKKGGASGADGAQTEGESDNRQESANSSSGEGGSTESGGRNTNQVRIWETAASGSVENNIENRLPQPDRITPDFGRACAFGNAFYFRIGSKGMVRNENRSSYLIGNQTNIVRRTLRPLWDPDGRGRMYDVDHKHEYQLGGPDQIDNLWLLDAPANRSSGSIINNNIERSVNALLNKTRSTALWDTPPEYEDVRRDYQITILNLNLRGRVRGAPEKSYSLTDIRGGEQIEPLHPMSRQEAEDEKVLGDDTRFVIFNNSTGGRSFSFEWKAGDSNEVPFSGDYANTLIPGFRPSTVLMNLDGAVIARLRGTLWSNNPALFGHGVRIEFPIQAMNGVLHAGKLDFQGMRRKVSELFGGAIEVQALSPVVADSVDILDDATISVDGHVLPTIPFFENADIRLNITGDEVSLYKTFSAGELTLPPPFQITDASLSIALSSSRGLSAEGDAAFKIDKVGEGSLRAEASTGLGQGSELSLSGRFNFDPDLFAAPSYVELRYINGELSGDGTLRIRRNSIKGIESGSLSAAFQGSDFTVSGSISPNIPGIQSATVEANRNDADGLVYSGELELAPNPAIRSGRINATLRRAEEGWRVFAIGTAQPAIPGVDSQLTVTYDDGAFDASFSGAFSRGMLSGRITAGATNRNIGEDGQPSGDAAPGAPIIVYGSGSATVRIAPWLQGTAGLRLDPNGEVTVSGEIGLPGQLEIFSKLEYDKRLFGLATQIPIIPGVVAEVGGNLSANANVGPGAFDQLRIGIEYNPAHEENTHVTGDAHLNVPAQAGLRLGARAGVGLGITGASATGGLEIGGTLGISGAAEASVHIDWMPSQGLEIDAEAALHAQPSFRFDVSGYVAVTALGASLYEERVELAAVELGSGLEFGVRFPVRYREGEPFDLSLDDLEFDIPDVDPVALVDQLGAQLF